MAAVQVQLTFNSMDEALVALARLVDPAKVVAASTPLVEKTPRQARSDAGKTRGPHKKDEPASGYFIKDGKDANASVEAGTSKPVGSGGADNAAAGKPADPSNATQSVATSTSTPPAAAPAPAAIPTQDQVQAAVEKLFNAKGFEECLSLMKKLYDVERGKDIPEGKRAGFIAEVDRALAVETA